MTWRPTVRQRGTTQQRPELTAVLDHYDVPYHSDRMRQMVSCPLHEDRTPSCSLDLARQLWNCMSCGRAGSAWDLVMEMESCDYRGAVEFVRRAAFAASDANAATGSSYGDRRRKPGQRGGYKPSWRQG
ncbi:CHC2 zinc finger domain-containing protein [Salinispora tropica]|uniref:CHC2 zinc finger domain-containing protein n=1 Tax=Salinispora tropica TaxID=168695 RepID=UPI0009B64794